MTRGKQVISLWDYDKESSSVTIPTVEIDETNLIVQDGFMDVFLIAVNGVSIGVAFKDTRVYKHDQIAGTPPSDKLSQRENKWLVQLTDDTLFTAYTMTIPCADLDLLDVADRGKMDKTLGAYTSLKTAIEQMYYLPNGNGVVVGDVIFVGRNL